MTTDDTNTTETAEELAANIDRFHEEKAQAKLEIIPRFTGQTYVAVLQVQSGGQTVFVNKVDLAKEGARAAFAERVSEVLPAVPKDEMLRALLKVFDERSACLQKMEELAAEKGEEPTLADMMVQIATDEAELSHDANFAAYATIQVEGHHETWPVRSRSFRLWVQRRLREEHDRSTNSEALQTALAEIEGLGMFKGPLIQPFVRLAELDGDIYLDLCDADWRWVRITASGWSLGQGQPPVHFIRSRGMLAMPLPQAGGNVQELRQFLNCRDDADFVLIVSWLLAAMRPRGPFPVLNVCGEQGSAKSTSQKMLRGLVDPNSAPLRAEPKEPRDLIISASNSWTVAFDNLSTIPPWLSDALCRLSTGGGFATRELYSDSEEVIFDATRPAMINGISDLVTRPDLLDRSLNILLTAIPEDRRKQERHLWSAFEEAKPRILGALLNAVAAGLANQDSVRLSRLPRLADFATWVSACEPGLGWPEGTFVSAYTASRESANEVAVEASVVAQAVLGFMDGKATWEGTASELLDAQGDVVGEKAQRRPDWPKGNNALAGKLRRVAPNLRQTGLEITFTKSGRRVIRLERTSAKPSRSIPSHTPSSGGNVVPAKKLPEADGRLDDVDGPSGESSASEAEECTWRG
jgi:hypothetical protein